MNLKTLHPLPTTKPGQGRPLAKAVQKHILHDACHERSCESLDKGGRWCLLRDDDSNRIMVRFVATLEANKNMPVFVVLYHAADQGTQRTTESWVQELLKADLPDTNPILSTTSAPLELKMIMKILKQNASLVPADYEVTRQPLEEQFNMSLLMPVWPLECQALSKLNNNMGCSVCSETRGYRCKNCQSVSYCSAECQRTNWADYKAACHSFKDATWRTVRLSAALQGMENKTLMLVNRHTSMSLPGARGASLMTKRFALSDRLMHADGGGMFLVKMQLQTAALRGRGHIMVYYQRMMFVTFVREDKDREASREFMEEIQGPRGYMGVLMHWWVKRTGDRQLSMPATDIKW